MSGKCWAAEQLCSESAMAGSEPADYRGILPPKMEIYQGSEMIGAGKGECADY